MLTKTAKTPSTDGFSHADMNMILSVLANQPLQNLQAARSLDALIGRFTLFCAKSLGPTPKAAEPPAQGKVGK